MNRFLPLLALILPLAGCPVPGGSPVYITEYGEVCNANSPPAIGNVELNSFVPPNGTSNLLSIHFDWIDPGVSGAADAPNLESGWFTAEIGGYIAEDIVLTEDILVRACNSEPFENGEETVNYCTMAGHGLAGCSAGAVETCSSAELTIIYQAEGDGFQDDQVVQMEFRIRDRCLGTSNEKSASYVIGSGLAVEGGGAEDEGA